MRWLIPDRLKMDESLSGDFMATQTFVPATEGGLVPDVFIPSSKHHGWELIWFSHITSQFRISPTKANRRAHTHKLKLHSTSFRSLSNPPHDFWIFSKSHLAVLDHLSLSIHFDSQLRQSNDQQMTSEAA